MSLLTAKKCLHLNKKSAILNYTMKEDEEATSYTLLVAKKCLHLNKKSTIFIRGSTLGQKSKNLQNASNIPERKTRKGMHIIH